VLHYYDIYSVIAWIGSGFTGPLPVLETIEDAWLVDYNAALATIGFMM
jgi:UDP-N-acetylglucosamine--dolichyl-phosphate N-acetylglucosaminephosphotransferase